MTTKNIIGVRMIWINIFIFEKILIITDRIIIISTSWIIFPIIWNCWKVIINLNRRRFKLVVYILIITNTIIIRIIFPIIFIWYCWKVITSLKRRRFNYLRYISDVDGVGGWGWWSANAVGVDVFSNIGWSLLFSWKQEGNI